MPLLRKVDAVVGQGDVPLASVGEADAQLFRQGLTELGKGAGVIHELRAGHPRSQAHRRWGDQQELVSIQGNAGEKPLQSLGGLRWATPLEQIVGPQHHDQQICVNREGGRYRRNFQAVLSQIADYPAGLRGQDVHPPTVCGIAPAEIARGS